MRSAMWMSPTGRAARACRTTACGTGCGSAFSTLPECGGSFAANGACRRFRRFVDAHSVRYRGQRLFPGGLLGQVRLLAGVRPGRAAYLRGPFYRAMDLERARRQERRAVRVLDFLDGRRVDDARLWLRKARARDHLRPGARNTDLYAQHHADLSRAQRDGEGMIVFAVNQPWPSRRSRVRDLRSNRRQLPARYADAPLARPAPIWSRCGPPCNRTE